MLEEKYYQAAIAVKEQMGLLSNNQYVAVDIEYNTKLAYCNGQKLRTLRQVAAIRVDRHGEVVSNMCIENSKYDKDEKVQNRMKSILDYMSKGGCLVFYGGGCDKIALNGWADALRMPKMQERIANGLDVNMLLLKMLDIIDMKVIRHGDSLKLEDVHRKIYGSVPISHIALNDASMTSNVLKYMMQVYSSNKEEIIKMYNEATSARRDSEELEYTSSCRKGEEVLGSLVEIRRSFEKVERALRASGEAIMNEQVNTEIRAISDIVYRITAG